MSESKSFASLSPTLLARKGGAKPAMRSQIQPLIHFDETTSPVMQDDLGWNDMGEAEAANGADVVPINGAVPAVADKPEVLRQRKGLSTKITAPVKTRQPVADQGRRAAFTLRIDAERHLRLRLATTVLNQSAQQIVTAALDRLLDELPEVESLARKVRKAR